MSDTDKASGSGKGGLIALALVTLVAAGAGGAHGLQTFKMLEPASSGANVHPSAAVAAGSGHSDPAPGGHGAASTHGAVTKPTEKIKLSPKIVTRPLQPIITNISMPPDVWVRLEGAIVYDQADVEDPDIMLTEVSGDLLAYLRSLTLREMQGADGLMFVRQDMKERIALRTQGKARDIVIQSLVMQ